MTERLPAVDPSAMTDAQQDLYRRFTSGQRAAPGTDFSLVDGAGRLQGPPAVWLLDAGLGSALEQLGAAIRFRSSLPARAREIAILVVAHRRASPFELHAHTRAGRAAGLNDDDLAALADRRPPRLGDDVERAVHGAVEALADRGTLDDAEFRSAVGSLGLHGLFELTVLVGWYEMLATQLAVFDVRPPGTGSAEDRP